MFYPLTRFQPQRQWEVFLYRSRSCKALQRKSQLSKWQQFFDDGDVLTSVVLACHFNLCIFRYVPFRHVSWHTTSHKFASWDTSRMMSQRSFVLRYDMGQGTTGSWRPNATLFRCGCFPPKFNCIQRWVSMKWKSKL